TDGDQLMAEVKDKQLAPDVADTRRKAVRVRAGVLLRAMKDLTAVIPGKATIPIVGCVLIEAGNGRISLLATDLDMWALRDLASGDGEGPDAAEWAAAIAPFTVALPGKALQDLLGEIDGEAMVTIEAGAPGSESGASAD